MSSVDSRELFAPLGPTYDRVGAALSFGQDPRWRRYLVSRLPTDQGHVLDVATGTGDVALEFARRTRAASITGLDPSGGMLEVGRGKIANEGMGGRVALVEGDALALPLADASVDVVSIAFGLRNLPDYEAGVREMARVLRPGGRLVVLEFMPPRGAALLAYRVYLGAVLPVAGRIISGSSQAYGYLSQSIREFMDVSEVRELLASAGLRHVESRRLSGGIAALYRGVKS